MAKRRKKAKKKAKKAKKAKKRRRRQLVFFLKNASHNFLCGKRFFYSVI